jgi:Na+-transporting NADH:ubiquinone oxidoreductase subunit NqrD
MVNVIAIAYVAAMFRLTAVEIPDTFDWPPRLWPTLFDFPLTDYAWIALIGVASFGVTVASVAAQRRGDALADMPVTPGIGLRAWLTDLVSIPCPTSSATRAQVWFDLKSSGLPVLTIGGALAIVILLMGVVSNPIDAATVPSDFGATVSCPETGCIWAPARTLTVLLTVISLLAMLFQGGNAFGIRSFEAAQAYGTPQLTALKLLVRSACFLAALIAVGVSTWTSLSLLGDEIFIAMWEVPLSSQVRAVNGALAALARYEQLALVVVAAVGVVTWVASFAVLGALRARYLRRVNIAAASLLLSGLALALLAGAERNGIVSPVVVHAIVASARWIILAAIVSATVYVFWSGFAERVLTARYACGALAISAAFAAAWLTVLQLAGVQLAGMPPADAVWGLLPALLPLTASVLAPWSLSRVRHT